MRVVVFTVGEAGAGERGRLVEARHDTHRYAVENAFPRRCFVVWRRIRVATHCSCSIVATQRTNL